MTHEELLRRLLSDFPRDPSKNNPEDYKLPRKLIALDEPLRTQAAEAFLLSKAGKDWAYELQRQERRFR